MASQCRCRPINQQMVTCLLNSILYHSIYRIQACYWALQIRTSLGMCIRDPIYQGRSSQQKPVRDEYGVSVIVVASVMTVAVTVAVTIVIVIWESMLYLLKLVTACYTIMTTAAAERQYSCSIAHRARALAT